MKQLFVFAGKAVLVLLATPCAILWACVQIVRYAAGAVRALRSGMAMTITCPVGHRNDLLSRWECRCGATFLGHAFDACPACGLPAGWIACATCGLAITARDR